MKKLIVSSATSEKFSIDLEGKEVYISLVDGEYLIRITRNGRVITEEEDYDIQEIYNKLLNVTSPSRPNIELKYDNIHAILRSCLVLYEDIQREVQNIVIKSKTGEIVHVNEN